MVLCLVVFRAEAFVVARPLVGNLEILAVSADLVAEYGDGNAIGAVVDVEIALFPGEDAVGAMRPGDAGRFHEIERVELACARARRKYSARVRACSAVISGLAVSSAKLMIEGDEVARGRDVGAELLAVGAETSGTPSATGARAFP
jgi:hypothetical protein